MARLLIVLGLFVVVVLAARRSRMQRAGVGPRKRRVSGAGPRASGPPASLVCGGCGAEFDPEKSGWICPKCGK